MALFSHGDSAPSGVPFPPWEAHPALVHFPITFLIGAVALDLYAWWKGRTDLARIATGLIAWGVITGVLAAAAGAVAFFTVPAHTQEAHRLMYWHMGLMAAVLALFAGAAYARKGVDRPSAGARAAGLLGAVLLLIGAAVGGSLVYRGGAGVDPSLLSDELRQSHEHGKDSVPNKDTRHGGHDSSTPPVESSGSPGLARADAPERPPGHGRQEPTSHEEVKRPADQSPQTEQGKGPVETPKRSVPEGLPTVPKPDAGAAQMPPGYRAEVVLADLTYPTSVEFDDEGTMYVAEAGFNYGDDVAVARILRVTAKGKTEAVAEGLNGPITDLLWHDKRLYISHRGKISALEGGKVRDLVTGLPSLGDHHNNQMTVGPDGKIYFGQGTATNSGVVGLDNFKMGWLTRNPDSHDVPAKDIRLHPQAFETPNPLTLLADRANTPGATDTGHEGHAPDPKAKGKEQTGDERAKEPPKGKEHEGHDPKATGQGKEQPKGKDEGRGKGQTGHDAEKAPAKGGGHEGHQMVKTSAFQPFGKTPPDDGALRGTAKASGTILRMNPDGSDLEVYAWGLRNPFGVMWGPDGKLYASDNGYDERGSRPIAHAPDCLWVVKKDAWYGFPDYAGGVPVTEAQFKPERGPAPKFLMRDHPPVEKPLLPLTHHVGAAKIDFARGEGFGFPGHLFLALSGDMNPITGHHDERSGFEVVRIDPTTGKMETFFKATKDALGPKGMEYVATAGPRRPVGVRFSPDGSSLYIVDVGAMAVLSTATGPVPQPFPGSGVVWRITRSEAAGR